MRQARTTFSPRHTPRITHATRTTRHMSHSCRVVRATESVRAQAIARRVLAGMLFLGTAGVAVGHTCYCCSPLPAWGDGSSDPDAYPCEPGWEVLTCEIGAYPNYTGECADGVRQRICYSFYPSSGLNVIHAACGHRCPDSSRLVPAESWSSAHPVLLYR